MKAGTQTALALAAGYLLGRRHKLRWAIMIAAAGATGKAGGLTGQLLRRGTRLLGSADGLQQLGPVMQEIAETARGELLEAGKAAATAAVSRRVSLLSDSLHDRAEALREPATTLGRDGEGAAEEALGQEQPAEEEGEEEPREAVARPEGGRARPGRPGREREQAGDGERRTRPRRVPEHDDGREAPGSGADRGAGRRRPVAASGGRSPVRRTGR